MYLRIQIISILSILSVGIALSTPALSHAGLELLGVETVPSGAGVKSVIISPNKERVYSANLEGMSVNEYDRKSRRTLRRLSFIPTPGKGYNYKTREYFDSYEEKPVELDITHSGRYLWISLHNAGGIVAWRLDGKGGDTYVEGMPFKRAVVSTYGGKDVSKQEVRLLLIKTGQTPKVITSSPDGKYLFVANWHSNNVSVIDISSPAPEDWKKLRDISARIPRGMLVTPDSKTLYIAEMGAEHIMEIALDEPNEPNEPDETGGFKIIRSMHVGLNPRHMLLHENTLYISLNLSDQIAALDLDSAKLKKSPACTRPRSMAMAPEAGVIFSVCYRDDRLQAFSSYTLELIGEWDSPPHPVGLDLLTLEDGKMEAWTANYTSGVLTVYTFRIAEEIREDIAEETPEETPEEQ